MIDIGLTTYLDQLQAAWKDNDVDELLWYSSFDGSNWSAPTVIPGAGSSVGPALDVFNGLEYAAWKGSDGDEEIWYSSSGTSGWAPQQVIPGVGSSIGPALAVCSDLLYAAWRGADGDQQVYYSSFDGSGWAPQGSSKVREAAQSQPRPGPREQFQLHSGQRLQSLDRPHSHRRGNRRHSLAISICLDSRLRLSAERLFTVS
jgi:hypothetical protein